MLLGVVLAWAVAAMQDAPRFTLTPQPGDALAAELFRLDADRAEEQVRALLGEGDDDTSEVMIQSSGLLNMAYRDGSLPDGPIILYAGPDADHAPDAACRLTRRPDGAVDNSERATELVPRLRAEAGADVEHSAGAGFVERERSRRDGVSETSFQTTCLHPRPTLPHRGGGLTVRVYFRLAQKRWMRVQASSSAASEVA